MAAVEKAVHTVRSAVIPKWQRDTQILQSPPAFYSKQGFKQAGKTLKKNGHTTLGRLGRTSPTRQRVPVCTTSAKYP